MSWQIISAMGTNMGNGGGGGSDLAGGSQGNGANHPPATEYTLQGEFRPRPHKGRRRRANLEFPLQHADLIGRV